MEAPAVSLPRERGRKGGPSQEWIVKSEQVPWCGTNTHTTQHTHTHSAIEVDPGCLAEISPDLAAACWDLGDPGSPNARCFVYIRSDLARQCPLPLLGGTRNQWKLLDTVLDVSVKRTKKEEGKKRRKKTRLGDDRTTEALGSTKKSGVWGREFEIGYQWVERVTSLVQ